MKERPILFKGRLVRAILEGRKTVTRRVVKVDDERRFIGADGHGRTWLMNAMDPDADGNVFGDEWSYARCPYGSPGDRLWCKETLRRASWGEADDAITYAADGEYAWDVTRPAQWVWKRPVLPSIHCPRGLSRLLLEVVSVRVERLHDITEEDAEREGVDPMFLIKLDPDNLDSFARLGSFINGRSDPGSTYRTGFQILWDDINGERGYGWNENPWVWRVEFKRATDGKKATP